MKQFLCFTIIVLICGLVYGQVSCNIDKTFKLYTDEYTFPFECQVGPQYNQFKMNYSIGGFGASVYVLTDSQYTSFLENVKTDSKYVPPNEQAYFLRFFMPDSGYLSTKGDLDSIVRNDFGKIRLLVKTNPTFKGNQSSIFVMLTMIPQQNNSGLIATIIITVICVATFLCCVGCISGIVLYLVKRRKAAYHQVI